MTDGKSRIESELEVRSYLQNLKYALDHDAQITFQEVRQVDQKRAYTIAKLFPNENPADALRRELKTLTVKEYMRTVKDLRFPKRSEMRSGAFISLWETYCFCNVISFCGGSIYTGGVSIWRTFRCYPSECRESPNGNAGMSG